MALSGPEWFRESLQQRAAANRIRISQAFDVFSSIQRAFGSIECTVLKGFTLAPAFCPDPESRVQYDLDLLLRREDLPGALEALRGLGYETIGGKEKFPADHLPPMIRKTGWQWRGDYFDTAIPLSVELHFRFWDRETERFGPENPDDGFLDRRQSRTHGGATFVALSESDSLAYASMHALRHLLRGDPRPAHFYEIAYFLNRQRDPGFWQTWSEQNQDPSLRTIQAICFRFAKEWFGCPLAPEAQSEIEALPLDIQSWFERWSRSPLEYPFHPNKDELWLHLCLLESWRDKAAVLRRRLLPLKPPGPVDAVHTPSEQMTVARHIRKHWRWVRFTAGRATRHIALLLPALWTGIGWFFSRQGLSSEFWRFFRGFVTFNVAMMVFFLLYNLHLIAQGFKEDFIGRVSSAMTVGSLLGSMIAGFVVSRIGLRPGLILCFVSQGAASAMRVFASTPLPLLGFAFLAGVSNSFFAVSLVPAVAALTRERNRPFAFSLTMSTGIALGMVAGLIGGRLPALLHSTQNALWLACVLAPLAALPLIRLRGLGKPERRLDFRALLPSAFLVRFLAALSLWGLATGAFNPFFNVYFARAMGMRVETIGLLFTASQGAQVVAMLLSPLVLRRLGLMRGIASMQAATGLALAGLGFATPVIALALYPLYMAFQYMSEPGIFSVLMSGVPEEERTGASAWNFIVAFAMQAVAAWAAGEAIARFGYTPVLVSASALALLAARAMTWVTVSR